MEKGFGEVGSPMPGVVDTLLARSMEAKFPPLKHEGAVGRRQPEGFRNMLRRDLDQDPMEAGRLARLSL